MLATRHNFSTFHYTKINISGRLCMHTTVQMHHTMLAISCYNVENTVILYIMLMVYRSKPITAQLVLYS